MARSKAFVEASHSINELSHSVALLEAENAKLRELLAELYQCSRQYGCDRCGYKDGCAMFDRMTQLGVEVE